MAQFITAQLDYITFFHGLAFVILAASCLTLVKARDRLLPWLWLGLFGFLRGVVDWLDLLGYVVHDTPLFAAGRAFLLVLSFTALMEFGRGALVSIRGKGPPRWTLLPFLILTAYAARLDLLGPETAARYALAFIGALVSSAALFLASRNCQGLCRRSLRAAGMLIVMYGAAACVAVPKARLFPASVINEQAFLEAFGAPVRLVCGILAVFVAAAVADYSEAAAKSQEDTGVRLNRWRLNTWRSLTLLAIVLGGWGLTNNLGKAGDELCRGTLLRRAVTAASAITPESIAALTGTIDDLGKAGHERLRDQLRAIRLANNDCRFVYLMGWKNGSAVFIADAEPTGSEGYAPPGSVHDDVTPGLRSLFSSGGSMVEGPVDDGWGSWVSGLAVAPGADLDGSRVVMGMDIEAGTWLRTIAIYRLFCIIVILVLCAFTLAFFFVLESARTANDEITSSEIRYRTLVESSSAWVSLLDLDGRLLTINPAGLAVMGWSEKDIVGTKFVNVWPKDSRKAAQAQLKRARAGSRRSFEAECVGSRGRRVSWHITLNPVIGKDGGIRRVVAIGNNITERKRIEEAVSKSRDFYLTLFEEFPSLIWRTEINGECDYFNRTWLDFTGKTIDREIGDGWLDNIHPEDLEQRVAVYKQAHAERRPFEVEYRLRRHDGEYRWVIDHGAPITTVEGEFIGYIGSCIDITDIKQAESKMRMHTSAMNAAGDQIVITNPEGVVEFVNPAFERESGYCSDEVVGRKTSILGPAGNDDGDLDELWDTVRSGRTWHGEIINHRKDGAPYTEDITVTPVRNEWGEIERYIAIKRNITEKKAYEKQLDHLAHYDHLTGLPNRLLFADRLTQYLAQARRRREILAVMFLDLDRFKNINDTLGHSVGDMLLQGVAARLNGCLRDTDTVARMGGDEFIVILSGIGDTEDAEGVAQKILDSLSKPFDVGEGRELFAGASIGISLFPSDGSDVETLVKNADAAMYRAKDHGRNNYQLCTSATNAAALERMEMETALRRALERDEFLLHYQPRVDLRTGRMVGVEALARWQHPDLGIVSPAQFIPIAEDNGLIVPIGEWVLRAACADAKAWQEAGLPPLPVAVNLSPRQFRQRELVDTVSEILRQTGLDPLRLELEITEGAIMQKPAAAADAMESLKEMGIRVSIDDFGSGYSSLSYLKRFPIDTLKIDQSFIKDITRDPDDAAIVQAILAMAHSLKLRVIAEGVETLEQLEFLRTLKCDEVQGYFVSRPVPAEKLAQQMWDSRDLSESLLPAA